MFNQKGRTAAFLKYFILQEVMEHRNCILNCKYQGLLSLYGIEKKHMTHSSDLLLMLSYMLLFYQFKKFCSLLSTQCSHGHCNSLFSMSPICSEWTLEQVKMMHMGVVQTCSKRYSLSFLYESCMASIQSVNIWADAGSSLQQTPASVTCWKSLFGGTVLEQNAELGSVKKNSILFTLTVSRPM